MKRFFSWKKAAVLPAVVLAMTFAGCSGKSAAQNLQEALDSAERGDWKNALRAARRAAARQPNSVPLQLLQAIACEQSGRLEPAIDYARRAVELDPKSFAAQYTLGRLCALSPKSAKDAVPALEQALKLRPDHVGTLILLSQTDEPVKAVGHLWKLQKLAPAADRSIVVNNIGVQLYQLKQTQNAARFFLAASRSGNLTAVCNTAVSFDGSGAAGKAKARGFYQYYAGKAAAAGEPAEVQTAVRNRLARLK